MINQSSNQRYFLQGQEISAQLVQKAAQAVSPDSHKGQEVTQQEYDELLEVALKKLKT